MSNHRRGWIRSFYYYMDWVYVSDNDKPDEKSVILKQVLMRQISLSKLKLKHIDVKQRIPPDLQKIDKDIISDETIYITPMNSPIKHVELSQKQRQARYGYRQI